MAGGKATPRQKMINMMYLVLTALLALNVSAEILQSFVTISNSLQVTAQQMNEKNNQLTHDLVAILDEQAAKGKTENQYLRPVIEEVAKESDKAMALMEYYIDRIKSDSIGAYDTSAKNLKKMDENQANYRFWMKLEGSDADNEGRGAGEARKLREKLNGFIKWANDRREKVYNDKPNDEEKKKPPSAAVKRPFKNLCIDPVEDPTVPQNSEMKKKPWEYYTFHGAPAIANVALLQKYKTDIRFIEADMLEFLKGRITDRPLFSINKLELRVAPESNRVLAGRSFKAEVYITMSLKGPADKAPRFAAPVKADPKNKQQGLLVIPARANTLGGKSEAQVPWSAKVQVAQSDGTWKSLDAKGSFTVVKPDLKIGSMKLNPLYRECANEVEASSMALGTDFNPVFKAVGGEAQGHPKEKNKVRLFPTGKTFKLIVSNKFDGEVAEIGSQDFVVKDPPAPDIIVKVGGKEWNPSMKIGANDEVKIICKAEPNFYDALPKDARYKIEKVNVFKRCGLTPREPAGLQVSPSDANHNATVTIKLGKADLQKGCNVFFEVEKISRVNYQDKQIDVSNQLTAIQRNIMGRID